MIAGVAPLLHSAFRHMGGHYREDESHLYVSRGVGVTYLPVRIGAPPEIPVLRLRCPALVGGSGVEKGARATAEMA